MSHLFLITGTFHMHMETITHSQAHKDIIIHSQSSTSVSSVMTKPSPNVDGPSNINSQLTSLYVCRDNNENKTEQILLILTTTCTTSLYTHHY